MAAEAKDRGGEMRKCHTSGFNDEEKGPEAKEGGLPLEGKRQGNIIVCFFFFAAPGLSCDTQDL